MSAAAVRMLHVQRAFTKSRRGPRAGCPCAAAPWSCRRDLVARAAHRCGCLCGVAAAWRSSCQVRASTHACVTTVDQPVAVGDGDVREEAAPQRQRARQPCGHEVVVQALPADRERAEHDGALCATRSVGSQRVSRTAEWYLRDAQILWSVQPHGWFATRWLDGQMDDANRRLEARGAFKKKAPPALVWHKGRQTTFVSAGPWHVWRGKAKKERAWLHGARDDAIRGAKRKRGLAAKWQLVARVCVCIHACMHASGGVNPTGLVVPLGEDVPGLGLEQRQRPRRR
eukprot:347232-Chlamydomonas_euryale.AAC.1